MIEKSNGERVERSIGHGRLGGCGVVVEKE